VSAGLALLKQQRVLLVDCDPRGHASLALGIDMQHVRYSVTDLLIPVDMGYFALAGMRQLLDAIARLRQEVPLTLATPHILLTKYDARTTLSAHVRAHLRERGDAEALHTVIRVNVALARAQMARQSIFAYDRTSPGAQDYQHVVEEFLGNRRAVASSGTIRPCRHQRRGPKSVKAHQSGRAAHAD
jgi:chromosome partitioning protein